MKITKQIKATEVPFSLKPEHMNDPKNLNLGSILKGDIAKEEARVAEEKRQAQLAELREKYSDIYDTVDEYVEGHANSEDTITELFELLVPASGKAETVAGELVRAANKLGYRWLNDGDKCYLGYGIETCGEAINYITAFIPSLEDRVGETAERDQLRNFKEDDLYDAFLEEVYDAVLQFIANHPDEALEPSEDMFSEQFKDVEWLHELEPKLELDVSKSDLSIDLTNYIEEFEEEINHYDTSDAFDDMLGDFEMDHGYNDVDIHKWARDAATITIPYGEMDENDFYDWIERWCQNRLSELEDEFGTYDELYERVYNQEEDGEEYEGWDE